jgi:hypothetical protein
MLVVDKNPATLNALSHPSTAPYSESQIPSAVAGQSSSRKTDLWVDATYGSDENDGLVQFSALGTLQQAADLAVPGTTVHIRPGVYRESVRPAVSGSPTEPIRYVAEDGPGTVTLRGSEAASSLTWTRLSGNSIGLPPGVDPSNVYFTDLSAWELNDAPRFVVHLDASSKVVNRLPLAREPDWHVAREWKHAEFWWAADGGASVPSCDPTTDDDENCDVASWSTTQLIDRTSDTEPAGIEPGNLTTLGDLRGGTLVVLDTRQGHWIYRRTIAGHDTSTGRITVSEPCTYGSSGNALGWGSKYYIEGLPYLLDNPGEWWYDTNSKRLYLWPPGSRAPSTMNIEISQRDTGFDLRDRSHTTMDGLTIEFYNGRAVSQENNTNEKSHNNTIRNSVLRYANWGLWIVQAVSADKPASNIIDGFTLLDSEVAHMDNRAIRIGSWWDSGSNADAFVRSGVQNTVIRGNDLHHLGFRTDQEHGFGIGLRYADTLRFEGNHVHHTAHHGIQFLKSVIQSPKQYDFAPSEIKTGEILVRGNTFEKACQLTSECAAVKIWGTAPDHHVYRDFLLTGNVFRDTFGWAYVAEKRRRWVGHTSSDAGGMGGFGLDVDMASGIHLYRNIFYNNANKGFRLSGAWRDGKIICYNNVLANSFFGLSMGGGSYDTHDSVDTRVVNNIIVNNEGYGILQSVANDLDTSMIIDHNLYYGNGWRSYDDGGVWDAGNMAIQRKAGNNWYFPTLNEIRSRTPWEDHGLEGNPHFWVYDPNDHDLHDGSWPDFHLTSASTHALNRGASLPASLSTLLNAFGAGDAQWGAAYDIGRYEWIGGETKRFYVPLVLRDGSP